MKKKELMRRLSAIAMAAMMTVTMIPSNAFAADIDFSDGGQDAIEVQADTDEEADAELSIEDENDESTETLTGEDLSEDETDEVDAAEVDAFSDDGYSTAEMSISKYKVFLKPVNSAGNEISGAKITVSYYDDYDEEDVTVRPDTDGSYSMFAYTEYTYSISADGYGSLTGTFTPDGSEETINKNITMKILTEDQKTVDAIRDKYNSEFGVVATDFAQDKTIQDTINRKLAKYNGISTDDVTVSVKKTDTPDVIALNGIINYNVSDSLNSYGRNYTNVGLVLEFKKNDAVAETKERSVMVGWDRNHFYEKMQKEAEGLTWNLIKGSNSSQTEVTTALSLPKIMTKSARTSWSQIEWSSSNPDVLKIQKPEMDLITKPDSGTINAPVNDTEVVLTATIKANENTLSSPVEKVSDFKTLTRTFTITVKGTGQTKPTTAELQKILNQYYTADKIKQFNTTNTADLANCKYDLQLPRYTRIKDDNDENVFKNKEITVTSENTDVLTVNGYKASVDRFASNEPVATNLIVSFKRDDVTVTKKIPVTIKPITEEEVKDQLELMDYAKAHYFDGINDGQYDDEDSVTGKLHPFQELSADKKWIYINEDKSGKGIIPDDQFTNSSEMEAAGYNKFKSSNNAVVAHESLVVTRQETNTQIEISSVLTCELYKETAEKYPENKLLQKLYKQPVSVIVTIKGTKAAAEGLKNLIESAQTLLNTIEEGNGAGQYPDGTKAKLQSALDKGSAILNNEKATEKEQNDAIKELQAVINEVKAVQNPVTATITVRTHLASDPNGELRTVEVTSKDAEKYGYEKPETVRNQVTITDALYKLHAEMYGEQFAENPEAYLEISSAGQISRIYKIQTTAVSTLVNNKFGGAANDEILKNGDELSVFMYTDTDKWSDEYLYFQNLPEKVVTEKAFILALRAANVFGTDEAAAGCTVEMKNLDTNKTTEAITDKDGNVTLSADQAGSYQITVTKTPYTYFVAPTAVVQVEAHSHNFVWNTTAKATVFAPEKQQGTCAVCGKTTTRDYGTKLAATIKLNAKSIKLQKKQTTKKIKVTMANGDSIKSWKSSNKKIVTVNKKGVIKAGKKNGTAKITVTLASGKKATLKVKVQSPRVNTTKIKGLKSKVSLKKGEKLTLKPAISPLTSQDKVTYTSSNKKVATVSKKGVITAKKKGTVKITVKSGKKSYTVKVKVK